MSNNHYEKSSSGHLHVKSVGVSIPATIAIDGVMQGSSCDLIYFTQCSINFNSTLTKTEKNKESLKL